jgi:Polyketide synthase dehydratase
MLDPEAGIPWIGLELADGSFSGEVVVGGELGVLTTEHDITGGLDPSAIDTSSAGPMIGAITGMGVYSGLCAQTSLDPATQPFLYDHRIDGTPVLPGVMGIEAFAALAGLAVPDMRVADVEQVDFIAPLKFYRDEPRTITVTAAIRPDGADLIADCTLSASRTLAGEQIPRVTSHFTGRVRLTATAAEQEHATAPGSHRAPAVSRDDIYRVFFHGPAYQVVDEAWHRGPDAIAHLASQMPADHAPETGRTTTEPRLAEACFQAAGLWEIGRVGHMALPAHVDLVSMPRCPVAEAELFAVAHPAGDSSFDCEVLDGEGGVVLRVCGYRTIGLDSPLPADLQRPIRDAMST